MACLFFSFLLLRMMWVRFLMAICGKLSMKLQILRVRILRSWGHLVVVVCMVPLIPPVIMIGAPPILAGIEMVERLCICLAFGL